MNETVTTIPLNQISPFPSHPFLVCDDAAMQEMVESIKEYGVLSPVIVREKEEGGYEFISGHRRGRACELAGIYTVPAIVKNISRDEAIIMMVDSNLQREVVLPSEKAKAYKMKLDAIKRQAGRQSKKSAQLGQNFDNKVSRAIVAQSSPDSSSQIQRYIRLAELKPELQKMVDDKKIALTPAVEISYLKPKEQDMLIETIESEQATPSLSQAMRIRKLSRDGNLNDDSILSIMCEQKKPERISIVLSDDKLGKYFPKSYTPRQMEETIFKLLDAWQQKNNKK